MQKQKRPHFRSNKEMTTIILTIGITFVLLGVFYSLKEISISSTFIFSIAISGFLFIVSDLLKIFSNFQDSSTNNNIASWVDLFRITCLVGSILTLIGFPYILTPSDIIENLATGFSIITIGLTIVNIAIKYYFENKEELNYVLDLADSHANNAERAIEAAEKTHEYATKIYNASQTPNHNKSDNSANTITESEIIKWIIMIN